MDGLRLEAIFNVLVEIRDRLPEKAEAVKSTSVTEVMADAIRLEKVRELAEALASSSSYEFRTCGYDLLHILNGDGE